MKPETQEILEKMEFRTPKDTETVELTDEEVEATVGGLRLTEAQYRFVALTVRNRMTSVVGEIMQLIEISSLSEGAQKAIKGAVKRSIWHGVRDNLQAFADISEITGSVSEEAMYGYADPIHAEA